MKMTRLLVNGFLLGLLLTTAACSGGGSESTTAPAEPAQVDPLSDKGIGPIKTVEIGAIDAAKATKGAELFKAKCSACHKIEEKYVGPALKDVTKRRTPEWIMNMILNPAEMTEKDPVAHELLSTLLIQMTFQNVTEDEVRSILEFFRQNDAAAAGQ